MTLAFSADLPVRVLAVIGAAAVGALLIAGCCQVAVKLMFGQKLPPWPLWVLRGLGAVACGWLVMLWLFGGGGGGIGGEGGVGLGSGTSSANDKEQSASKKGDRRAEEKDEPPAAPSETLTVEVLGDDPLRKLAKSDKIEAGSRYRVAGEPGLRSLEEVRKLIRGRRDAGPPLKRLELVLYRDSPSRQGAPVAELAAWANDLEEKGKKWLRVDFTERDRYAPVE